MFSVCVDTFVVGFFLLYLRREAIYSMRNSIPLAYIFAAILRDAMKRDKRRKKNEKFSPDENEIISCRCLCGGGVQRRTYIII